MRVVQINLTYGIGSTGRIVADIDKTLLANNHESYIVCGYTNNNSNKRVYTMQTLPTIWDMRKDIFLSRMTGRMGYNSKRETRMAIDWIKDKNPDIVHLHNIHGNYINVQMLFNFLKSSGVHVSWTLHDCWAFTGRCSNFETTRCEQWKTGCKKCPSMDIYPISYFFDFSKKMWADKYNLFTSLKKMYIITPSKWLENYVSQSFLRKYEIRTIHNGIDLDVFKPLEVQKGKRSIILGVASSWCANKGFYDIFDLDAGLDHEKYKIILVGLNERQMKILPKTITGVKRTHNVNDLVRLYSFADVFINPTYQDNYPTVNLEAIACGTPVITYKTGGSSESVDESVGVVINKGNIEGLRSAVKKVINKKELFDGNTCREYALKHFSKENSYGEYISMFESAVEGNHNE